MPRYLKDVATAAAASSRTEAEAGSSSIQKHIYSKLAAHVQGGNIMQLTARRIFETTRMQVDLSGGVGVAKAASEQGQGTSQGQVTQPI